MIALVTNVLSHYRVPCFEALAQRTELTVFLLAADMPHRTYVMAGEPTTLRVHVLKGLRWHRPPFDDRHLNTIWPVIKSKPDTLILSGWDEPTYWLLWVWAVVRRKRFYFWIESTAYDGVRRGFKERLKRLFVRTATGCIVPGQRAKVYCEHLGAKQILMAPNAIDRAYFQAAADELLPQRPTLRHDFGIDEKFAILFVGRFVEFYKNVALLIEAYRHLIEAGVSATLLLVGDGIDRSLYEMKTADLPNVHFAGLVAHAELCRYYAAADVLVLPSHSETWGFVLNEAMEFGLPLIVSEAVGAGPDLVQEAVNGYTINDATTLAARLLMLAQNPALRQNMGAKSREIITAFSPDNWATGVYNCDSASASV